jgi:hypothetical protein
MKDELETWRERAVAARNGAALGWGKNPREGMCDRCGGIATVADAPCQTAYQNDALNVEPVLCQPCSEEYHEYWDEMWREANSGRL